MRKYNYAATLFHPGGTVAPPVPAPSLPPLSLAPGHWEASSALRGPCGLVPDGTTRVIFRNPAAPPWGDETAVGFDFIDRDYRAVCGGPSCTGRTAADFVAVPSVPAPPRFY